MSHRSEDQRATKTSRKIILKWFCEMGNGNIFFQKHFQTSVRCFCCLYCLVFFVIVAGEMSKQNGCYRMITIDIQCTISLQIAIYIAIQCCKSNSIITMGFWYSDNFHCSSNQLQNDFFVCHHCKINLNEIVWWQFERDFFRCCFGDFRNLFDLYQFGHI